MISRRRFLMLTAGSALLSPLAGRARSHAAAGWLGCRRSAAGDYSLCLLSATGEIHAELPLPGRGHAVAAHPQRAEAVVLARRPGTFLIAVDLPGCAPIAQITSPADRHFYGHAAFTADGRHLYATENDFAAGRGVIGVYDAADGYRRLGEIPSHGVGPHELRFLSDGGTLVVANGGIRTHPDLGRARLNLDDMQPNLAYVDAALGHLLDVHPLPPALHQLSIRHIDVTRDDTVCIAMQYAGPADRHPPLVALHRGETALQLLTAPEPVHSQMRNYCGSIACDGGGRVCAVTAPRGGLVTFWSIAAGRYLGSSALTDCCAIAAGAAPGEFLLSNGRGRIARLDAADGEWRQQPVAQHAASHWDNHLTAIPPTTT